MAVEGAAISNAAAATKTGDITATSTAAGSQFGKPLYAEGFGGADGTTTFGNPGSNGFVPLYARDAPGTNGPSSDSTRPGTAFARLRDEVATGEDQNVTWMGRTSLAELQGPPKSALNTSGTFHRRADDFPAESPTPSPANPRATGLDTFNGPGQANGSTISSSSIYDHSAISGSRETNHPYTFEPSAPGSPSLFSMNGAGIESLQGQFATYSPTEGAASDSSALISPAQGTTDGNLQLPSIGNTAAGDVLSATPVSFNGDGTTTLVREQSSGGSFSPAIDRASAPNPLTQTASDRTPSGGSPARPASDHIPSVGSSGRTVTDNTPSGGPSSNDAQTGNPPTGSTTNDATGRQRVTETSSNTSVTIDRATSTEPVALPPATDSATTPELQQPPEQLPPARIEAAAPQGPGDTVSEAPPAPALKEGGKPAIRPGGAETEPAALASAQQRGASNGETHDGNTIIKESQIDNLIKSIRDGIAGMLSRANHEERAFTAGLPRQPKPGEVEATAAAGTEIAQLNIPAQGPISVPLSEAAQAATPPEAAQAATPPEANQVAAPPTDPDALTAAAPDSPKTPSTDEATDPLQEIGKVDVPQADDGNGGQNPPDGPGDGGDNGGGDGKDGGNAGNKNKQRKETKDLLKDLHEQEDKRTSQEKLKDEAMARAMDPVLQQKKQWWIGLINSIEKVAQTFMQPLGEIAQRVIKEITGMF